MEQKRFITAIVTTVVAGILYTAASYLLRDEPVPEPQAEIPKAQAPTVTHAQPPPQGPVPEQRDPFSVDGENHLCAMVSEAVRACVPWKDFFSQRTAGDSAGGKLVKFKVSEKRELDSSALYTGGACLPGKVTVSLSAFETGKALLLFSGSAERALRTSPGATRQVSSPQEYAFEIAEREAIADLVFDAAFAALTEDASAEAIERIGRTLESDNPAARRAALRALTGLGRRARPAVASLAQALAHSDESVSAPAAELLVKIGREAVPEVVKLVSHRYSRPARNALEVLGHIGPDAGEAVPALITNIQARKYMPETRAALARIGEPAVRPLVDVLKNENSSVRRDAAEILGEIGYEARSAVPILSDVANGKDSSSVRRAAKNAMDRILDARPAGKYKIEKIE